MAENDTRDEAFLSERRRLMGRVIWILFWVAAVHIAALALLAMTAL